MLTGEVAKHVAKNAASRLGRVLPFPRGVLMPHVSSPVLEKYLLLRSTEAQASRVEKHVLLCSRCRQRLDELEALQQFVTDGLGANADAGTTKVFAANGEILNNHTHRAVGN